MQFRDTFQRKNAIRSQKTRILIVCEDEKHSVSYFQAFCKDLGLTAAEVEVCPSEGSAPKSVAEYAKKRLKDSEKHDQDNSFDYVYCVFDRDAHSSYNDTLANLKKQRKIRPIFCNPSFELWILLHFECSSSPINNEQVIKKLKQHIPKFDKKTTCYAKTYRDYLKDKTETALKNSKHVLKEALKSNSKNPKTNAHELIDYLKKQ